MVLVVKNLPANAGDGRKWEFNPWVRIFPWRRAWQPTLVFLPGEFPRTEEPGGLGPQGRKELDMTEMTEHA